MYAFRLPQTGVAPRWSFKASVQRYSRDRVRKERRVHRWNASSEEGPILEKLDVTSKGGLGGTSDAVYGPLAIMLVGFSAEEFEKFEGLLRELEAEMVTLIPCNREMMDMTLGEAIESGTIEYEAGPLDVRRTVFLSGMYATEVQEVITAYRDLDFPPAVFAACIPKNKDTQLGDLIEEVYDDHIYMIKKRQKMQNPE